MPAMLVYFVAVCVMQQAMLVKGQRFISNTEHQCRHDHRLSTGSCRWLSSGVRMHPCQCLLDQIKCYARRDCNLAVFDMELATTECLIDDTRIFRDNCALFSDAMALRMVYQTDLAWGFCALILVFLLVYSCWLAPLNRGRRNVSQDSCVVSMALLFTIFICLIWINGMASLVFVLIYVVAGIVIYFGWFYGLPGDYDDKLPADGSGQELLQTTPEPDTAAPRM